MSIPSASRRSIGALAVFVVALGCDSGTPAVSPMGPPTASDPAPPDRANPGASPEPEAPPDCEALARQGQAELDAIVEANAACTFDSECARGSLETPRAAPCAAALHPRGLQPLSVARRAAAESSPTEGCERVEATCPEASPRCVDGACRMQVGDAPSREVSVPEQNAVGQDPPPARPPPGDPERDRASRLLAAIAADDPALAQDFFFPREAFARVKAIPDPDAYWRRLFRRYEDDIHALHAQLGDLSGAELVRLDVIRRGGWVPRGEEGNALPYWVSRHSRLVYRAAGEERSFEVRVLITWGDRWYVTHLSEFH